MSIKLNKIANSAINATRLAEQVRADLETLIVKDFSGADLIREAVEQLSAKGNKGALATLRTTVQRISAKDPENGGIGTKISWCGETLKETGKCVFIEPKKRDKKSKRDILSEIARELDADDTYADEALARVAAVLKDMVVEMNAAIYKKAA